MADVRTELYTHHKWANERLLTACEALSDEELDSVVNGVYGSIRATLVHLFAAESRYVAALQRKPRPDELHEDKPWPGFPALCACAAASGAELIELAQSVGASDSVKSDFQGQAYDLPLSVPLAQVINHATEHRTNITTIMATLGLEAPELDLWQFFRERFTGSDR